MIRSIFGSTLAVYLKGHHSRQRILFQCHRSRQDFFLNSDNGAFPLRISSWRMSTITKFEVIKNAMILGIISFGKHMLGHGQNIRNWSRHLWQKSEIIYDKNLESNRNQNNKLRGDCTRWNGWMILTSWANPTQLVLEGGDLLKKSKTVHFKIRIILSDLYSRQHNKYHVYFHVQEHFIFFLIAQLWLKNVP